MSASTHYGSAGASGYNQGFGSVSGLMVPSLLRMADVKPGFAVLDVGTGTGIAAEAAANLVGSQGRVVGVDNAPAMLEQARRRSPMINWECEDALSLSFSDGSFDAVICSMALMLFPDHAKALSEFYRVLKPGGRAAASVNTVPNRSYLTRVTAAMACHVPSMRAFANWYWSLGDAERLRMLFRDAKFDDVTAETETYRFPFPSFDAYFQLIEAGLGGVAADYADLPADTQQKVKEEIRQELEGDGAPGGPVVVEVEILYGSGRKR